MDKRAYLLLNKNYFICHIWNAILQLSSEEKNNDIVYKEQIRGSRAVVEDKIWLQTLE